MIHQPTMDTTNETLVRKRKHNHATQEKQPPEEPPARTVLTFDDGFAIDAGDYAVARDVLCHAGIRSEHDFQDQTIVRTIVRVSPDRRIVKLQIPPFWILTTLPESIGRLTHLREMIVWSPTLRDLPDEVGELQDLQTLWLGNAAIHALPDSIGRLAHLEHLYLVGCRHLATLPESLGNLQRLHTLLLEDLPAFARLPVAMRTLEHLHNFKVRKVPRLSSSRIESLFYDLACLQSKRHHTDRLFHHIPSEDSYGSVSVKLWPMLLAHPHRAFRNRFAHGSHNSVRSYELSREDAVYRLLLEARGSSTLGLPF